MRNPENCGYPDGVMHAHVDNCHRAGIEVGIARGRELERAEVSAAAESGPTAEKDALTEALELLDLLRDPSECWFDHAGGCQAHGFLILGPGGACPNERARRLVQRFSPAGTEANRG